MHVKSVVRILFRIISDTYGTNDFDLMDITTGPSTQGMDGIGIIVNQRLVMTTADIDELIALNQSMSVKFVIIQTKTSTSFDNMEMNNLFTYANLYFGDNDALFSTDEMKRFLELKNYIFDHGNKLRKNPELELYYVTLGTWNEEDTNLTSAADVGKRSLTTFTEMDKVLVQMENDYATKEKWQSYAKNNDRATFMLLFEKDFPTMAAERYEQNDEFFKKLFSDPDMMQQVMDTVGSVLYERLRSPKIYDPNSGVIEEATPETYVEDVYAKNVN